MQPWREEGGNDVMRIIHEQMKTMPSGEHVILRLYKEDNGRPWFGVYTGERTHMTLPPYVPKEE